jgi:hypothetical protein
VARETSIANGDVRFGITLIQFSAIVNNEWNE